MNEDPLAATLLSLCAALPDGKTLCPIDAAQAVARQTPESDLGWERYLPRVRSCAVGLARQGRLVIYRKGKPVDPDDFRGVYRLGLPRED